MKKRGKNKRSKGNSKKNKSFFNEIIKNKLFLGIGIIILAIIVIYLIIWIYPNNDNGGSKNNGGGIVPDVLKSELTPLELIQNKEKYEGKIITLKEAYIPSQAFVYIKGGNFTEKLFIDPRNKQYCRNFDLEGKLRRDTTSAIYDGWIFQVDQFTCIKK